MVKYIFLFMWSAVYAQSYPVGSKYMNEQIVFHKYITLQYNEKDEQARWVYYKLHSGMLSDKVKRKEVSFTIDPLVKTGSADNSDYRKNKYDKGHLCPANDMQFSKDAMRECFYLSNAAPQLHSVNAGDWRQIELFVHKLANYDTLYVVTGTLVNNGAKKIGKNEVSIPNFFWKSVYSVKRKSCISFLVPNIATQMNINEYVVTTDLLEDMTGLDLWSDVGTAVMESNKNTGVFED